MGAFDAGNTGARQWRALSTDPAQSIDEAARLAALRARQQRQAARGCLLALVLEGAAILAAGLWLTAMLLELPRLKAAGLGAFVAFTLAAMAAGGGLLIMGNLPAQRRLRRRHDPGEAVPGAGGPGSGADKTSN